MHKDFDQWNGHKKHIHTEGENKFYHQREVWWCALGVNVGFEQDGGGKKYMRPVLIIKGFSREVCLCVPLTTKQKEGKYYHAINLNDGVERKVILSQIRLLDTRRLLEKIGIVDVNQFNQIKQAVIRLIE